MCSKSKNRRKHEANANGYRENTVDRSLERSFSFGFLKVFLAKSREKRSWSRLWRIRTLCLQSQKHRSHFKLVSFVVWEQNLSSFGFRFSSTAGTRRDRRPTWLSSRVQSFFFPTGADVRGTCPFVRPVPALSHNNAKISLYINYFTARSSSSSRFKCTQTWQLHVLIVPISSLVGFLKYVSWTTVR